MNSCSLANRSIAATRGAPSPVLLFAGFCAPGGSVRFAVQPASDTPKATTPIDVRIVTFMLLPPSRCVPAPLDVVPGGPYGPIDATFLAGGRSILAGVQSTSFKARSQKSCNH